MKRQKNHGIAHDRFAHIVEQPIKSVFRIQTTRKINR
jgi:hypothetical protein